MVWKEEEAVQRRIPEKKCFQKEGGENPGWREHLPHVPDLGHQEDMWK